MDFNCPTNTCVIVDTNPTCGWSISFNDGSSVGGYVVADVFTLTPGNSAFSGFTATFGVISSATSKSNGGTFEPVRTHYEFIAVDWSIRRVGTGVFFGV